MLGLTGIDLLHLQFIAKLQVRCFVPSSCSFSYQLHPTGLYFWPVVLCIHTNFFLLQLSVSMIQLFIFETKLKYLYLPGYYVSKNITTALSNLNYKSQMLQYVKLVSPYIMQTLFNSIE